jgi:hypothetical protein
MDRLTCGGTKMISSNYSVYACSFDISAEEGDAVTSLWRSRQLVWSFMSDSLPEWKEWLHTLSPLSSEQGSPCTLPLALLQHPASPL